MGKPRVHRVRVLLLVSGGMAPPPTAPPQTVRGETGKDPGIADGDGTCCVLFVPRALAHSRPSLASLLQHL